MNIIHLNQQPNDFDYLKNLVGVFDFTVDIDSIKEVIYTACRKCDIPFGHYYDVRDYPNSNATLSLALYPQYDVHKLLMWIGRYAWDDNMMELLQDVVVESCLVDGYVGTIIHFVNVKENI
jgi:hypothetical protein